MADRMNLVIFVVGIVAGVIGSFWVNDQFVERRAVPSPVVDATIFLQLSRDQLEDFANEIPTAEGKLKSVGNILGGTELTTVRHTGRCGSAPEIENYIREFLQSDRYICYEARYAN